MWLTQVLSPSSEKNFCCRDWSARHPLTFDQDKKNWWNLPKLLFWRTCKIFSANIFSNISRLKFLARSRSEASIFSTSASVMASPKIFNTGVDEIAGVAVEEDDAKQKWWIVSWYHLVSLEAAANLLDQWKEKCTYSCQWVSPVEVALSHLKFSYLVMWFMLHQQLSRSPNNLVGGPSLEILLS